MAEDFSASTPTNTSKVSAAKPYSPYDRPRGKSGNGSGWVLAVAVLQFVGACVQFGLAKVAARANAEIGLAVMLILSAIFFCLWLWARKSPFPALLTALIVFVTVHALDAVVNPLTLFQGIIMKIVVIAGLCTAIKKAYVAKRRSELDTLEAPPPPLP